MPKIKGLRIIKKVEPKANYEINFKATFEKEDKETLKMYINEIMQTSYSGRCVNVEKTVDGRILLTGTKNYVINDFYMSEIRYYIN